MRCEGEGVREVEGGIWARARMRVRVKLVRDSSACSS